MTRKYLIEKYEKFGEEKDKRYLQNCLKNIDGLNGDKAKILELIDSKEA